MLRAYKKKKRELIKTKDALFKSENEGNIVKQKNLILEEEMSQM